MSDWRAAACASLLVLAPTSSVQAAKNIVVVLDDSGSMGERMAGKVVKLQAAKEALISVLETIPDDAQLGILLLNGKSDQGEWVVPLGPIDKQKTVREIQKIRKRSGTPLGQFMKMGTDELLRLREKQHYGTYSLLVLTDGEANDGELVERYLPDIMSRGITVDVIGVDMKSNHSLATRVHSYRRADDPQALTRAIAEVFAESTANATASGESDFEFLEGFPDEVAAAALVALAAASDNDEILGMKPRDREFSRSLARNSQTPSSTAQPSAPYNGGSQSRPGRQGRGISGWLTTLIVMIVIFSLLQALTKSKKHRRS